MDQTCWTATMLLLVLVGQSMARTTASTYQVSCGHHQFLCPRTASREARCITNDWVCDQYEDCENGEDEVNCQEEARCYGDDFMCSNGDCIPDDWKCDGDNDCYDGDDEHQSLCAAGANTEESSEEESAEPRNHGNTGHSNSLRNHGNMRHSNSLRNHGNTRHSNSLHGHFHFHHTRRHQRH